VKNIKKKCTKCGNEFEATPDFFYRNKNTSDGLTSWCKGCMIIGRQEYLKDNYYKVLNYRAIWRANNPEENRNTVKQWQAKNSDHVKEYSKKYRQSENGKEKYKIYNQKHRNHDISKEEWNFCKEYFNNCCAYCEISNEDAKKVYEEYLHKDHLDHDGVNDITNCVPACKACNSAKWQHPFESWYNEDNPKFSSERYEKIQSWIEYVKTIK
jgi:hypothetical protein